MATTRSAKKVFNRKTVLEALEQHDIYRKGNRWRVDGTALTSRVFFKSFARPIAVFPRRLNDRMSLQSSVFTLHGGKNYIDHMRCNYQNDEIPKPIGLEEIHPEPDILRWYRIPYDRKPEILLELFKLGIHEASLFPEVDKLPRYLQSLWWYPK